jgi:hypothetical protein
MTIALQRTDSEADTVFFDAVLTNSSSYQSKLTAHPIDGAGSINDHIVTENPTFTLKGVFSSVDFNTGRPSSSEFTFVNNNVVADPVNIIKVQDTLLETVIGSLSPFGKSVSPQIELADREVNSLQRVKNLLISIRDNRETVTMIEFEGTVPTTYELDLVITNLQFSEDPDSGDVLNVDITLQRATFIELKTTKVAKSVSGSMKDKASTETYKGPLSKDETTTVLQDVKETITTSLSELIDSFKKQDGKSLPKTVKFLKDTGVLPK